MEKDKKTAIPELLAPAGSMRALEAAIDGGADAVYFGASEFNARIGAENFSPDALKDAVALCRAYRVKSYVTLNTLVHDRELDDFLLNAENALNFGADALIVADLGAASLIKKYLPHAEMHASTQFSGHNAEEAKVLSSLGFSRMVLARETPLRDIRTFVANSPIEAEVFIHGALCVSHSGQCLFSSAVGGRSGNRGECAQPCRLPYEGGGKYPLSLRDLCLAPYIPELISAGVASLKIEGRMKPPEYVKEVTSVYRTLLDERRGADSNEIAYLASVFSRGGFTHAYFDEKISSAMLGVRSESDKENSRSLEPFLRISRRRPVDIYAYFRVGEPSKLTLSDGERSVTVFGDAPEKAINAPMTEETVLRSLTRLGDTPFEVRSAAADIEGSLMLPVSRLNALRRAAVAAVLDEGEKKAVFHAEREKPERFPQTPFLSARFLMPENITPRAASFFERIYVPLDKYAETDSSLARGVIIPPVIFDHEAEEVKALLENAKKRGAEYALCGNLGHARLALDAGLSVCGDFRLNIFNREALRAAEKLGFAEPILSPELSLAQLREIGGPSSVIVYGRLPLMLLEKCVIKEIASCEVCGAEKAALTDRRGVKFPVFREWKHRNVIYNSLPTYMGDKKDSLGRFGILSRHFIFTDEDKKEVDRVISAYEQGKALGIDVRRIKN